MADMFRICPQRGCPEMTTERHCAKHARERDKARGTKAERGYGKDYQARRRDWDKAVARGIVDCSRCGQPIGPNEPWHLDHDDKERDNLTLARPSHQHCNTSAGGKAAHQ